MGLGTSWVLVETVLWILSSRCMLGKRMSSRSKMTLSTIGYDDKRRRVEVSSLGFNGREMASDVGDELSVSPMKPPVTSSTVSEPVG